MNGNPVTKEKIRNISPIPKANILITILVGLLPLLGAMIASAIWFLVMNSSGGFSLTEFIAYVPKMHLLLFVFAVELALVSCVALMVLRGLGKRINAILLIAAAALPWLAGAVLTSLGIAYGKRALKMTGGGGIATFAAGLAESGVWRLYGALLSCLLLLAVSIGLILLALVRKDEERRLSWLFITMACGLPLLVFSVFWVLSNQETLLLIHFTIVVLALIGLASWAGGPEKGAAASAAAGLSFLAVITAVSSAYLVSYFMRVGITGRGGEPVAELGPLALLLYVGGALALLPALVAAVRAKGRGRLHGSPVLSMVFFLAVLAAVILVDWLAYKPSLGYMKFMASMPQRETLHIDKFGGLYLNHKLVEYDNLQAELVAAFLGVKDKILFLEADQDLEYRNIVDILEPVQDAGINTIGIIVDDKQEGIVNVSIPEIFGEPLAEQRGKLVCPIEIPDNMKGSIVLTLMRDGRISINKEAIESYNLQAILDSIYKSRENKTIFIRAYMNIPLKAVLEVIAMAKKSEVSIIGIIPEIIDNGKLVPPVEIPEEELNELGKEGGVEGGVVGGVLGGVVGGVLGGVVGEVEAPVRAIGDIKPPKVIKEVKPVYPEIAKQARVEGVVIVEATTDIYGRVQNVKVLRSIPLLDQAAIDAVRQWVYEPMIINGRPRGVIFTVTIIFDLSENKK